MVTTDGLSRMRLRCGRRVDVWQGGDPHGAPVVFFHGTPGGRLQAALGDGAARRVGVRLIALSRPGYGGSTDAPTSLGSVAADTAEALGTLGGLDAVAVLGVSGGGPFALAVAATVPDRVTAVGVVAGVGPLLDLDPSAADRPAVRAALAGHPEAAIALQDAMLTRPASPTSSVLHRGHMVGAPEIVEPMTGRGQPGLPPLRGASRDALALAVGWDVDLDAVTAPVHLWYGDRDRLVGLEHGRWLRDRLPTSTLVVREGAGHLATLMAHWHDILTTLARPSAG